jgi:hypothetical protein
MIITLSIAHTALFIFDIILISKIIKKRRRK